MITEGARVINRSGRPSQGVAVSSVKIRGKTWWVVDPDYTEAGPRLVLEDLLVLESKRSELPPKSKRPKGLYDKRKDIIGKHATMVIGGKREVIKVVKASGYDDNSPVDVIRNPIFRDRELCIEWKNIRLDQPVRGVNW